MPQIKFANYWSAFTPCVIQVTFFSQTHMCGRHDHNAICLSYFNDALSVDFMASENNKNSRSFASGNFLESLGTFVKITQS